MTNQTLSEIFRHMAELLEFFGDPRDSFRIRAYRNVSLALNGLPDDIEKYAQEKKLRTIPGVGEGIARKIEEFVTAGHIKEYEVMKRMVSPGIFELMEIPSLGPKKVRVLCRELGIENTRDLEKAVKSGKVAKLPGFGEKSSQKILEGLKIKKEAKGRILLGEIYLTVKRLVVRIEKISGVEKAVPAGSFRRCEETVGDVDILVTCKNPKKIMESIVKFPEVEHVLGEGETKTSVQMKGGFQMDVRVVAPGQFGSALQYFTGSKAHNVQLRTLAKAKGFKLSEYGFYKGKKLIASKTEEECYRAIGMQYIPPELRSDTGEIQAALKKQIPQNLIEAGDLRGDLHAHSAWSDGEDTIEQMALEAQKRGYEYIALTDHSPSLRIANGLKLPELKKKKLEIERLNERLGVRILFGTEVDIKADGSIDYPDEVLRMFDVVVASIHSRFGQDNTERMLKAMENPFVHIIGHASGRLIGRRNPYHLDYEKIFQKAASTGTVLEINSQPSRLDLRDIYLRDAKRHGVKFSIDSDAHSTGGLWVVELGCGWAKRGWVEKADVINTLPLKKLEIFLKSK